MLRFFTRLEKTRNFVLFLFAILMVGSLVFFYTPASNTTLANLSQSDETAASVSGEDISVGQLVRQKENYSRFGRGQSFPAKMLLEGLISSRITRLEADRLGLTASDGEVAARIREQNKPTDGKVFDQAVYEQNVTEQFGGISDYEQSVRDDISTQKLQAFMTSGVTVSEEDVLSDFQRKNSKFEVSYVAVGTTELAKTITPSDAELREYFEKNKATYFINTPQKKVKYVFVNTAKIGEKLQISDTDLRAEYEKLPADKKTGGTMGQEIVLRIAKPEDDGQVQAKAAELVAQLRKDGQTVTEETFGVLAKGQSENPATALNGGKLAGPVKENLSKTDDPYQQLLRMKPGEITDPIEYEGRYFVLRRGEDVAKPYDQAKKEIEVSLRNRRAYGVAAELAQKVVDSLKQTKDPLATAQAFAGEANSGATEMVKETGFLKPGDDVPNIGVSPQFEEGIAPLAAVGDVGEKTPIQNGFAIPILIAREEPRDAEFDDVKAQVVEVVKLEQARLQVEDIAKQIAAAAGNAGALAGAASAKGLTVKDQKDFILGSPLGEGPSAGTSEALEDAVYALKAGEVTKNPIKVGDNWYVVSVKSRQEADMAEFAKERSGLLDSMLSKKRGAVFADYLAATKAKLEADKAITIYKEALDKVDAPVPGLLPQST
ncbi:MAG: peptidyl-prolyl cis-trans isomerase [Pyrinomonadaceae bacterium]